MAKDDDNAAQVIDITEQPTGEFPALSEFDGPSASNIVELNGVTHAAPPESDDSAKAAFWLAHLETEVSRLHAKWQTIDAEFKTREARIADLHGQVAAREASIAELTADLQHGVAALDAADERIASKDGEIAALAEDRRTRDERIAALSTELADAEVAHKTTREEVERVQAETVRLNKLVRQEQAAAEAGVQRNAEMLAEQQQLQAKLQDLETYVNGRHESWSEQKTKLADYKDALIGMENTVKARNAVIARHDDEKRQLASRILDLERQCAELAGRRKEREDACDELQRRLAGHFERAEQLKLEHTKRTKEMEHAVKQAVDSQRHIESLERGIKRRDETLEAVTGELEQSKNTVAELTYSKNKLAGRVDELEKGVADRSQQVQALRGDLRVSHDELRVAQQQLSDRTTQVASTQEAVDQKARQVERLTQQLDNIQQDGARVRDELDKIEAHAAELGRLHTEAIAESEKLKAQLAAQHELVTSLETELESKRATEDMLERSVGRITDLGASLAALDKRMNTSVDENGDRAPADASVLLPIDASMLLPPADKTSLHLADFVAMLGAHDKTVATADDAGHADEELLFSMDLPLDDGPDDVVNIGEPTLIERAARKLIVTVAGEARDYPIVKNSMTIGRGHESDIRIQSHFVSRVHAKISTNDLTTVIEDAGSKNGILVNSERVKRRVLHHGDVVSIGGELNLKFVDAMH